MRRLGREPTHIAHRPSMFERVKLENPAQTAFEHLRGMTGFGLPTIQRYCTAAVVDVYIGFALVHLVMSPLA